MNAARKGIALVTGASSGIGLVTAQALAQAGYRVFGTSRKVVPAPGARGPRPDPPPAAPDCLAWRVSSTRCCPSCVPRRAAASSI
ncbi:SDR family NAD(P)-dependent oxidoreductase [Candidatus Aalborgicola defluviihabitans]|uniref:SDR family NAD(P)-dependent oxidoreductase n=1 Tax=Candidatus Aalborgicola defluviihabitans TaxID=3386187 RepID=UPI0039B95A1C